MDVGVTMVGRMVVEAMILGSILSSDMVQSPHQPGRPAHFIQL
jgi:hypothetical protein